MKIEVEIKYTLRLVIYLSIKIDKADDIIFFLILRIGLSQSYFT